MDCIFCKIVSGEIPSSKIYEEEGVLSFLDITPAAKGHTLVIPKKHYETLLDIPDEELEKIIISIRKIAEAVTKAMGADGFNLLQSNKREAGQVIPHAHFHIIPRSANDGLRISHPGGKYKEGEIDETARKIKEILKKT